MQRRVNEIQGREESDSRESNHDESKSSNDDNSDEGSLCSDSDSQRSFLEETLYRHTNSVVRRRPVSLSDASECDEDEQLHDPHEPRTRTRRRRRKPNPFQDCFHLYSQRLPLLRNQRTNALLMVCFLIWFAVQLYDALQPPPKDPMQAIREHSAAARDRLRRGDISEREFVELREEGRRKFEKSRSFWGGAAEQLEHLIKPASQKRHKGNVERLPPGCKPTAWQTLSFPNCNEIHEFDLREALGLRNRTKAVRGQNKTVDDVGYVGEGMWRTVWKVQARGQVTVALKTTKGEHEVDTRNLERHRRDALTMERLTSSPYIVSIYGYCGNTVLTEYLSLGLDKLVYNTDDTKAFNTTATRQTPLGRLRLALHVARGVAAIHDIPGGPIIHADIQAKQFLVDSQGIVKLNDFNRNRFMANNTATGKPCPLRIPTAPGSSRSQEEYNFDELTESIDMYSTAHVLYAILTGEKAWGEFWGTQIKKLVKKGSKPPIDEQHLTPGTSDAALANLIDLAYEFDPRDRLQASKLVHELERLIAVEEAK